MTPMTVTPQDTQLFSTQNDLPESTREAVINLLNKTLATTLDLYTQCKQAHWSVKGPSFYTYHLLFDAVATAVEPHVDEVAERITALGGVAHGTVRKSAGASILPEFPDDLKDGLESVKMLSERFAAYGQHVREAVETCEKHNDVSTADLYTQLSREVDKQLWFLEAHLR